jgi:hypothetical protein
MEKEYNLKLTEFEILTLREGLYCFKDNSFYNLTEEEFEMLDNKLKEVFKNG